LNNNGRSALQNCKVLIVCDDPDTGYIWSHLLRKEGLDVFLASSQSFAKKQADQEYPDLVIIDEYSPEMDGIEIIRTIRSDLDSPIIYITPINNESHILSAYEAGVDECVVKPISPALFLVRVRAFQRRIQTIPIESFNKLQVGDFRLDPINRSVLTDYGQMIKLSNMEYRLMQLFMQHPNWLFRSEDILLYVWGYSGDGSNKLLKHLIFRLRRKIEDDPRSPAYLIAQAGGYIFQPERITRTVQHK